MQQLLKLFVFLFVNVLISSGSSAQNVYELRQYSDQDWLNLNTNERLKALNTSNNHAINQTLVGDFNKNEDLYAKWGYDYYEMHDSYENYAFRGFENYNIIEDRRNKWYYNQFGDRLTKMTASARIWLDRINDDGTSSVSGPSGFINNQGSSNTHGQPAGTDGIWVARESTNDWAISAVGAGALRAKLTPLTMSLPNLTGMKIDFQSANYSASMVNSALTGNSLLGYSVLLRGGQFRRKFGALNLGATYSTMYNQQLSREGGTSTKGTVHDFTPTPMYYAVRVMDDSPNDGNGPEVQNVRIIVNGKYRDDIQPTVILDDFNREKISAVYSKSQQTYFEYKSTSGYEVSPFENSTVYERVPKYLDYLYMMDYVKGWNSKTLTDNFNVDLGKSYYKIIDPAGKSLRLNGSEYVVYLFDLVNISERVNRVQVEVSVSNDYRIQTSQIYTKKVSGGHDTVGENFQHYNAEYWRTMAQADGNIKDNSNLRTVLIDFGFEVGNTIYGFDAQFNYLGFRLNGEFVTNTHYYMYSDNVPGTGLPPTQPRDITRRSGHRSSQTDNAYFVTFEKEWNIFGLGGEIFKMGKFYRPYMNLFIPSDYAGTGINDRNDSLRLSMIEDNDDNDTYPDIMYDYRVMGVPIQTLKDPDGVFPGNDNDYDGIPDNNKNYNNFADYDEPFIMFDIDPDEFVFGDDFDNNGIPDFREDDIKYDTPYELDRQGNHYYLTISPQKNINFVLGSFKTRNVGENNRTDDKYFKTNITYDFLSVGNIYAEYRYEKIQDNIQDPFVVASTFYHYNAGPGGAVSPFFTELFYDELEYRNSEVNKIFVESKIRGIPSLIIDNHLRYERNHQIEGEMYDNAFQPEDVLSILALSSKFSYIRQFGNWTINPGIKFRLYKKGRSESLNPLDHYLMRIPLVYLKYRISNRTNITIGAQGIPGIELKYNDFIQDRNNYYQKNYIFQIENRTTYFGFNVWGGFGFKLEDVRFEKDYRSFENKKSSTFFVQTWLGYD